MGLTRQDKMLYMIRNALLLLPQTVRSLIYRHPSTNVVSRKVYYSLLSVFHGGISVWWPLLKGSGSLIECHVRHMRQRGI